MLAKKLLERALESFFSAQGLASPEKLAIEEPKNPAHGDLSVNAALLLAKPLGKKPREVAEMISAHLLETVPEIEKVEVAGPGFCNVTFRNGFWQSIVSQIEEKGAAFGRNDSLKGRRALVEYVSANPTGPLHIGHGRGAALGDSVTRILRACGAETATEYYLNDAGLQMETLGLSIWLRLGELLGRNQADDFPENCYQGKYITDLAADLLERKPEIASLPEPEAKAICREYGMQEILSGIRKDLEDFRCEHQSWFSEKSLVERGAVKRLFSDLEESGASYEADGALWFRSARNGDDHDRVLRKSDSSLTYFASDIAYHRDKFERGYDLLIDVWGADHHGYIPRMRAAIAALGENPDDFNVLLVQLVNLLAGGEKVAMSTRAGKFETLADVVAEVGVDAARFMFLSRSADAPLDFDLDLAKSRSMDNPVYYVQYAHARIAALLRRARELGIVVPEHSVKAGLALLDRPEELAILRRLAAFEDVVAAAGRNLAPQYIGAWLLDLATRIHGYYAKYTVLDRDRPELTLARIALLRGAGQALRNALYLLGVSAPENM